MKELREREARMYHEARTKVLKSDDPEIWIDGPDEWLAQTMEEINEYIRQCLVMDDDPLRYLREYFPDFKWEFHEDLKAKELVTILSAADYIWSPGIDIFEEIITATEISLAPPRLLCFITDKEEEYRKRLKLQLRTLVPSIRFVVNGSETQMGTFIE